MKLLFQGLALSATAFMHEANAKILSPAASKCLLKYWILPFFHVNQLEIIKFKAMKKNKQTNKTLLKNRFSQTALWSLKMPLQKHTESSLFRETIIVPNCYCSLWGICPLTYTCICPRDMILTNAVRSYILWMKSYSL